MSIPAMPPPSHALTAQVPLLLEGEPVGSTSPALRSRPPTTHRPSSSLAPLVCRDSRRYSVTTGGWWTLTHFGRKALGKADAERPRSSARASDLLWPTRHAHPGGAPLHPLSLVLGPSGRSRLLAGPASSGHTPTGLPTAATPSPGPSSTHRTAGWSRPLASVCGSPCQRPSSAERNERDARPSPPQRGPRRRADCALRSPLIAAHSGTPLR